MGFARTARGHPVTDSALARREPWWLILEGVAEKALRVVFSRTSPRPGDAEKRLPGMAEWERLARPLYHAPNGRSCLSSRHSERNRMGGCGLPEPGTVEPPIRTPERGERPPAVWRQAPERGPRKAGEATQRTQFQRDGVAVHPAALITPRPLVQIEVALLPARITRPTPARGRRAAGGRGRLLGAGCLACGAALRLPFQASPPYAASWSASSRTAT